MRVCPCTNSTACIDSIDVSIVAVCVRLHCFISYALIWPHSHSQRCNFFNSAKIFHSFSSKLLNNRWSCLGCSRAHFVYCGRVRLNQAPYTIFGQMLRSAVFRLHRNKWMLRNRQSSITSPNTITHSCVWRASNRQITRQIHGPMTSHTHTLTSTLCTAQIFSFQIQEQLLHTCIRRYKRTHSPQDCRVSCYSFVGSLLCPTDYTVYFI